MNRLLLTCYCFLMGLILFMAQAGDSNVSLESSTPFQQNKVNATTPAVSLQLAPNDTSVASLLYQH